MDAKDVYTGRRRDIAALLNWISLEVEQHAAYAEKEGVDFAHCGDLGHLKDLLVQALAFLAQQGEEAIRAQGKTCDQGTRVHMSDLGYLVRYIADMLEV